jgi:hypothetical protein
MADALDDIEARINQIRSNIAALQSQLEPLERAAELIRPIYRFTLAADRPAKVAPKDREETINAAYPDGDFTGLTILEAAERILRESDGAFIESKEIAKRALSRGYRTSSGRNPEGDPEKIIKSFNVIMRRHPDQFERQGRSFRLKQQDLPDQEGA